MEFESEDDATHYSLGVTARRFTPEEADNRISDYNKYAQNARSEEDKIFWQDELSNLTEYIESDEFKNGCYPRGIDELILELIEWRAALYAFQNVDTEKNPFTEHVFHAQWLMGGTYTVFCLIGKLVSSDNRDNSLRKLWDTVKEYVANSGLCEKDEADLVTEIMHKRQGHFTNDNSKAILFRNKYIAHNESLPQLEWIEVDKDIKLLCRVWSLITMWSSFGIMQPFRSGEIAFSGLDNVFNPAEIKLLNDQRESYIKLVKKWSISSLIDEESTSKCSPFGELSISFSVNVNKANKN
ncbi:hypothetical protein ACFL0R_04690 [Pseudomonadota bacterium]